MLILLQLIRHFKKLGQSHINELIICLDEITTWDTEEMGDPMDYLFNILDEHYGIELSNTQLTMLQRVINNGTWETALKLEGVSFK